MSGFSEVVKRYKALTKKALEGGKEEKPLQAKEGSHVENSMEGKGLFEVKHVESGEGESKVAIAITLIKCARKFFTDESKFKSVVSDVFNDLSFNDIINEVKRFNEDLAELIRLYIEVKAGRCMENEGEERR